MLENLDVYLSDSISKVIAIRQNGSAVIAPQDIAYFHLEEQDGRLRLYIPKDRKRHHVCLIYTLPQTVVLVINACIFYEYIHLIYKRAKNIYNLNAYNKYSLGKLYR